MMCKFVRNCRDARARREAEEREKIARVEQAEEDLARLQERKDRALSLLTARDKRNHWREGIQQMIQGGTP